MMAGEWLYFGCGREAGHYLFGENGRKSGWSGYRHFNHLDGTLPPQPELDLYVASFSRLGGWNMTALAWWDRSVDRRPGSNSTILAPGLEIAPDLMLVEAARRFPWVFARLPQPLRLMGQ